MTRLGDGTFGAGTFGGVPESLVRPDLAVEIAFPSDPEDPAPTYVGVTADFREGDVRIGRGREMDHFDAGESTARLNDPARHYDPTNGASPHAPNVIPGRVIRAQATWQDVTYPLFRHFIDDFRHRRPSPRAVEAVTELPAFDLLASLAQVGLPGSVFEAEALAAEPYRWYRLGDAGTGTTAVDNARPPGDGTYVGDFDGGDGLVAYDDAPSAVFTAAQYVDLSAAVILGAVEFTIVFWAVLAQVGTASITRQNDVSGTGTPWAFFQGVTNQLVFQDFVSGPPVFRAQWDDAAVAFDGNVHLFVLRKSHVGGQVRLELWMDNVVRASDQGGAPTAYTGSKLYLGGDSVATPNLTGRVQDFMVFLRALSDAELATLYSAGTTPWAGDTSGQRVDRVLDIAGVADSDRDVDTGNSVLQATRLGGSALEYLRLVERSENGQLYADGRNRIVFVERHARIRNNVVTATFSQVPAVPGFEYSDLDLRLGIPEVINVVRLRREGGPWITDRDDASVARFRERALPSSRGDGLLVDSDEELRDAVLWVLAHYADPVVRIDRLVLYPETTPALWPVVLGLAPGQRFRLVGRLLGGGDDIDLEAHVEGYHHFIGKPWRTEVTLSPADTQPYLVLDDPDFGRLDVGRLAY